MKISERVASQGREKAPRINREPSRLLAHGVPWVSVLLGSLLPLWMVIASAPLLPPLAFLIFISWRQLRPGLLPVWAGLPLGLFDDLYSGQPIGSAVMLWSAAAIALDFVEARLPWRHFPTDWLLATGLIMAYIPLCLLLANLAGGLTPLQAIVPQIVLSVLCYPLVDRLVYWLDRMRLIHFLEIR